MMVIRALLRKIMLPVMPSNRIDYDILIGKATAQHSYKYKSPLISRDKPPSYFIGLVFLYYPIVPAPLPCGGWKPTKRILMVWNGLHGYQEMQRKDLHHACGWKPHRIHIKQKGAAA